MPFDEAVEAALRGRRTDALGAVDVGLADELLVASVDGLVRLGDPRPGRTADGGLCGRPVRRAVLGDAVESVVSRSELLMRT